MVIVVVLIVVIELVLSSWSVVDELAVTYHTWCDMLLLLLLLMERHTSLRKLSHA